LIRGSSFLNLGAEFEIKPQNMVIGFKHKGKVCADVLVLKSELKFWINLKFGNLDDPKKLSRDISNIGQWGNGDYEFRVSDTANPEYIMSLIKQAVNY
jgi:predicted transport protein